LNDLIRAKIEQAAELLREAGIPLMIAQFARESHDHPQPVQELLVGTSITWPAAFLIAADGSSLAIVGTGDTTNVQQIGAYDGVLGYVKDVGPPLRQALERFDPDRIAVSYGLNDDGADNITHGMFLVLQEILEGTAYAGRLVSAESILVPLRARKLATEIARIRAAIDRTIDLFALIDRLLVPGMREEGLAAAVHQAIGDGGMATAWDARYDPAVNFGPLSPFGHARPADIVLEPGMLVHVDLGLNVNGYCSDLQRMWYLLRDGEETAPNEVVRRFDAVVAAMRAGFEALRPGVAGWEVDAAARLVLTEAGYDEPEFALGHQLGQTTHDGGALLGPRWPRYGNLPNLLVEEGNVFTLEYGMPSQAGAIGVEEDVLVTADGAEFLTAPQTELIYLRR
jgi:Xaa-Pro aminopeptidase